VADQDQDKDSKTEEPTERRLEKAREDGQVPQSQEIKSLAAIFAGLLVVGVLAPWVIRELGGTLSAMIRNAHAIPTDREGLHAVMSGLLADVGWIMAVPIGLIFVTLLAASLGQVGLLFTTKKLQPKISNVSLKSGIKRLVSKKQLAEFIKSLFKVLIVGLVAGLVLVPNLSHPDVLLSRPFAVTLEEMRWLLVLLLAAVVGAFAPVAVADWIFQRHQHREQLRMTKQEVKDEHKQSEGDPLVKGKIRELRIKRSRERMMANVPGASVVVTNPTHYAVALKYEMDDMAAPVLVAKGVDNIAAKIREVAEDNDVPIVENPPLARALYASVELDQEVPPEHYKAVAEVIGYVMRLKKTGAGAGPAQGAR